MKIEKSVVKLKEFTEPLFKLKHSKNPYYKEIFFSRYVWFAYMCSEETISHIYDCNKDEIITSNWFEVLSSFTQLNFDDEYKFYTEGFKIIDQKPMKDLFVKASKSIMMNSLVSYKRELGNDKFNWDDFYSFLENDALYKYDSFKKKIKKSLYKIPLFKN
jgi:hypothetical protein